MKIHQAVVLSLLSGFALGGAAVQTLQAQSKPPIFLIAEIEVTDAAGYQKEYAPKAQAAIKSGGGVFLFLAERQRRL